MRTLAALAAVVMSSCATPIYAPGTRIGNWYPAWRGRRPPDDFDPDLLFDVRGTAC
jgi:hypothetical protein